MGLEQYRLEASGFNNRAVGVLLRAGVKDIKDIAEYFGEYELKRLPNCGKETVQHIKAVLKKHKIKLSHGTATAMTAPVSDRARNAAIAAHDRLLDPPSRIYLAGVRDGLHDDDPLVQAFATFERETPGFAAGVEAAAKCAEAETGVYPHGNQMYGSAVPGKIAKAIRNLTPAPPASEGLDADEFSMGPPPAGVPSYWPDDNGVLQPSNDAARATLTNAAAKHPD